MTATDDEEKLLLSVAMQNANSVLIARRRAEQRGEAHLAEAQRLSQTGSFDWRVSTGDLIWSEETFRIFQYDRTTKPTMELVLQRVHQEDAAVARQAIERASQDGKDFEHECRLAMPDGSAKHVHVVAHALGNERGGVEFVGAVMDVTAAKQAEERIRQNENELRIIIDAIPAMSWSALPNGSPDFFNQRWLAYTGLSLAEGRSGGWMFAFHPEERPRIEDEWRATVATGAPFEKEARIRRADGEYRWFLIRAVPLRDELGNIVKWYGTTTDIEDRKRAEMLLAGEKRLLEIIARGGPRALILDALCRLVEELASGSLSSILLLDPNTNRLRHGAAPSLPKAYTKAIDGLVIGPSVGSCGTAAYRAEPVIVSDIATDSLWADYRDLALTHGLRACWSRPILSSEGKVLGTFATYYREPRSPTAEEHDVTEQITHLASIALERERAEEVLRQAQVDLARVARLTTMGELAASIAHEINQPLTGVVSSGNACLRWLANDRPNLDGARGAAERIVRDAHRAGEIIRSLRTLATKSGPEMTQLDINDAIREVLVLMRSELHQHDISLETALSDGLEPVMGDRVQLQQVVLNLIMNGIEAMSAVVRQPRVLRVRSQIDGPGALLIAVEDSGPGLAPETMDRLFDPFFTTKPSGMGMGLSICRSIVDAHGGRLWASPQSPRGAVFQFTMPTAAKRVS